jgi:TonB-linked SusC/RagA family outer membrane protein
MWAAAYSLAPDLFIPQYSDGRFGWNMEKQLEPNPVALGMNVGIRRYKITQMNSDFALEQNLDFITKGLSAQGKFYYDNSIFSEGGINEVTNGIMPNSEFSTTRLKYINSALYTGPDQDPSEYTTLLPTLGVAGSQYSWAPQSQILENEAVSGSIVRRMQYQFQVNYARKFGKHNIGALGVFKRQEYAAGSMFRNYREDWVLRATYDYDTRYLFEMNGAYNGSEQFGPGYRFEFFPSVALGWVVSNEKFFKIDQINRLKLRFSIGMVGDDKVSGNRWLYESQLNYGNYSMIGALANIRSPYTWYSEKTVGNPDIRWEKATKTNYGAEMSLFNDLISVGFDYFTEDRTDILIDGSLRAIPPFYGTRPPSANLGHVKSSGYEVELKFDKKRNQSLHYWAAFAFSHTENKILFKDDPLLLPSYLKQAGYTIGQTRSTMRAGRYNNWDEIYASVPTETNDLSKLPGFWDIIDFNADGIIRSKDDQIPTRYSGIPQNTYNLTIGGDYKGFSAMVQFYGVSNVTRSMVLANFYDKTHVGFEYMSDYWTKDNQDASAYVPRWLTYGENVGDYWLFDASYLRLKTVEIAYTFRDKWLKKTGLAGLRIYLNGNNLYIWTDLLDDRESAVRGGTSENGAYPNVKRTNLGVEITF